MKNEQDIEAEVEAMSKVVGECVDECKAVIMRHSERLDTNLKQIGLIVMTANEVYAAMLAATVANRHAERLCADALEVFNATIAPLMERAVTLASRGQKGGEGNRTVN